MLWSDDAGEVAVREFCYGSGRAVPRSVFLGRVVAPGDPLWLQEDVTAALEWQAYQRMLCSGCSLPRSETFDIAMDDGYDADVWVCHACAARERKQWNRNSERNPGVPPGFGEFYSVAKAAG
jgi:hypothetical protein